MRIAVFLTTIVSVVAFNLAAADEITSENYALRWDAFDTGGGTASSETYIVTDTVGQSIAVGESFSTNYIFAAGFQAPPDDDADLVKTFMDNCSEVMNTLQRDSNQDGYGNACDPDLDDDGQINFLDLGLMKERFFSSDADADLDGDGAVNFIDLAIMKAAFFGVPGPSGLIPE